MSEELNKLIDGFSKIPRVWTMPSPESKSQPYVSVLEMEVLIERLRAALGRRGANCETCLHLTPFELTDELFTCPVVNIRIHRDSANIFGCNQHEAKP